jgi:anti-anti-sigma factor
MTFSSHHLEIDLTTDDTGRRVLKATGAVDRTTGHQLVDEVDAAAEGTSTVVIDLRDVRFMDSPGVGSLVYCNQRLAERHVTLVVRAPQGEVRELLELLDVDRAVRVEPSTGD